MKINGSLVFDASSASEIQNLRVEKVDTLPTHLGGADAGRIVYLTTDGYLYKGNATAWVALATGGNAFSQTEGDAIETALGAAISTDGVFVPTGFTNTAALTSPTSFTNAIQQIADYATANDSLFEMNDVTLSSGAAALSPAGPKFLFHATGAGQWTDHTLVLADVTDVTTTFTELNQLAGAGAVAADFTKLHAVTASAADLSLLTGGAGGTGLYSAGALSATQLSYLGGATPVTSSVQAQLNNKQPLDSTLTALAGIDALTGILVETAPDTFVARTLVAPAAGFTITEPAGILGNPTFALANDLAALEGLTTFGYIVRTADGTAVTRSLSTNTTDIVITGDASGVTTDTTFALATVTQVATGTTFSKFALDTKGRVIANTPVVLADIKTLADGEYVNAAGDSMTGNLVMASGTFITLNSTAVAGTDAVNKAYVDAATQGLSWKNAVVAASIANVTVSAPGATIDGVTLTAGDRVLLKNQTTASENGVYIFTGAATAMTRALDMDAAAEFDGSAVFVQQGTVNEGTGWTETLTVTTVGTSPVAFSQFSGGQAFIWGTGIANTGNTIFLNLGAGIKELPSDEIGIDVVSNLALQLTGTGTATGDQLTFVLDTGSGLEQSATGLKISAAGVTNAMLLHPQFTLNGDSGTDALVLGDTLQIKGTSGQGISTATTESPAGTSTVTITASDASASQKGVATFNTASFTATAGDITIKAAGVTNTQLANSTVTIAGTTGSDAVALGETLTFSSTVAGLVSSTVATNGVALDIRLADASNTGVASFDANMFTVTAGAVTLTATLDDLTNVSSADAAATGDLLTKTAGDWQNVTRAAVVGSTSVADHNDVTVTTPAAGEVLSYTAGGQWINKKIYHMQGFGTLATVPVAAATTWVVAHALGAKFCNVTVVDSTDNVVIPQSIVFDSTSQLTVTFNTAISGTVIVMAVA